MVNAVSNRIKPSQRATFGRAAVATSLLVASGAVNAGLSLGAGVEYFSWREYDDFDHSEMLEETGPRVFALAELSVPVGRRTDLLARGRVYSGDVDYDGALNDPAATPLTTTTEYLGAVVEGGFAFGARRNEDADSTVVILTLGIDNWTRDITGIYGYEEEYRLTFLRLGAESEDKRWKARGGLLLPLKIDERIDEADLDLEPEPNPWFYIGVGYRATNQIELALDYQGYRLDNSDPVFIDVNGDGVADTAAWQPRSEQDTLALSLRLNF